MSFCLRPSLPRLVLVDMPFFRLCKPRNLFHILSTFKSPVVQSTVNFIIVNLFIQSNVNFMNVNLFIQSTVNFMIVNLFIQSTVNFLITSQHEH